MRDRFNRIASHPVTRTGAMLLIPGGPLVLATEFADRKKGYPRAWSWIYSLVIGAIGFAATLWILRTWWPDVSLPLAWIESNLLGSFLVGPLILAVVFGVVVFVRNRRRLSRGW